MEVDSAEDFLVVGLDPNAVVVVVVVVVGGGFVVVGGRCGERVGGGEGERGC